MTMLHKVTAGAVLLCFPSLSVAEVVIENPRRNWGGGSCVWAAATNMADNLEGYNLSTSFKEDHIGAANFWELHDIFDDLNYDYMGTSSGEKSIFHFANNHDPPLTTVIGFHYDHACLMTGFSLENGVVWAHVLNSNDIEEVEKYRYQDFIDKWRYWGGDGVCLIPAEPLQIPSVFLPRTFGGWSDESTIDFSVFLDGHSDRREYNPRARDGSAIYRGP